MTDEQQERLKQIRLRWSQPSFPDQVFTSHVKQDIDFLLSLYDSQADTIIVPLIPISAQEAATSMRSRCVEKLRQHAELCRYGHHDARNELLDVMAQLKSLPLEQGEQEKQ